MLHPVYGECVISQELYTGQMKLWVNKRNRMKIIIEDLYKKLEIY